MWPIVCGSTCISSFYNLYQKVAQLVCLLERLGPIDRTPGIPGSDKYDLTRISLDRSSSRCYAPLGYTTDKLELEVQGPALSFSRDPENE